MLGLGKCVSEKNIFWHLNILNNLLQQSKLGLQYGVPEKTGVVVVLPSALWLVETARAVPAQQNFPQAGGKGSPPGAAQYDSRWPRVLTEHQNCG